MTQNEIQDWLKALGDCVPEASVSGLKAWAASRKDGRFELGLSSSGLLPAVQLRWFASGPPSAFPSELVSWSTSEGRALGATKFSAKGPGPLPPGAAFGLEDGKTLCFTPHQFSSRWLKDEALAAVLADFAVLCPLRELVTEWDVTQGGKQPRPRLWIRPEQGFPWRRFARLNLSDPFKTQSALLSYLLLDLRVKELAFQGEELWVYLGA